MADQNADGDSELDRIVADYLQAVEAGQSPDAQAIVARHPGYAKDLLEFFAAQAHVGAWRPKAALASTKSYLPSTADYQPAVAAGAGPVGQTADREIVLAGRYRVFDVKRGGMGCVYLAEDMHTRQRGSVLKVAIKTVADFDEWRAARRNRAAATYSTYRNLLERFRREASNWVRLGVHNNIIFAMFVIEVGTKPHLVMEYAESGDLHTWIREGRLNAALAVNFAIQFCDGMDHAARTADLVHRDIKPQNVLIKDDCIVKIADFGLASAFRSVDAAPVASGGADAHTDLSQVGAGTASYMPPEQFRSLALADTRSDIFSFGAMLFEMLTSQRLFGVEHAYALSLVNADLPQAHELNPHVPQVLSAVVQRCVRYDPAERYGSFAEVRAELARINDALPGKFPMPRDPKAIPAESLTDSIRAEAESYSLLSLGRYQDAAERAQRGIDADPNNHALWVNRGAALLKLKDFAGARACFNEATRLKPDDARSWSNICWAELTLGRPAAGLAAANQALRQDAKFGEAWMCRGCCERHLHGAAASLPALTRAVELEPHNWKAHSNLGISLAKLGRRDDAFASFQTAAQANPSDALTWRQLGWLYTQADRWSEAKEAADRALKLDPENEDTRALRAWIQRAAEHEGSDDDDF